MRNAKQTRTGISGIVLAGGKSQRMGRNKALMELGGRTLISRVLDKLARLCDELIISAYEPDLYGDLPVRVVTDVIPGRGALGGIHAGLTLVRNQKALVVACDMPFLSLPLLRYMTVLASDYDIVVPWVKGNYEPLHAIYDVNCINPIERLVAEAPRRVVALYQLMRVRAVTDDEVRLYSADLSFFNVNVPEDLSEAHGLIALGHS